jgi:hypothetical protein
VNELERFNTVLHFEKPDYYPLLLCLGGYNFSEGGIAKLHREGLPEWVADNETWCRYWGQCTFDHAWSIGAGGREPEVETWIEGDFEFWRSETGALTRNVKDWRTNHSMPEFIEFDVRDRTSWDEYKSFGATHASQEQLDEQVQRFEDRTRPLMIHAGGTWGWARNLLGPERALMAVYDEPDLLRDMIAYRLEEMERLVFPVIEAVRPEVVNVWEDFAYNHGMLISPKVFRELCAPYYRRVASFSRDCGAELLIVDCDGKVDQFCVLLEEVGFNGSWPLEQVCGNPVAEYRRRHPNMIFIGGIEKEIVNSDNGHRIDDELAKIPPVLEQGGYFPTFDHMLQITVGFDELCRCMTQLHEICGSSLGSFPRRGLRA